MSGDRLTPTQARAALVYCAVVFVVCVWCIRLILAGDWEGVVYTSNGAVIELKYFFVLGAVGCVGAFFSMLGQALPDDWKRRLRSRHR
ncbi:MAG: hypothetical protein C4521_12085 [Actinobacteria bacterium]|nr:MAG: hypothetical protein C4521_12085 [Actinomycetota bacterium]